MDRASASHVVGSRFVHGQYRCNQLPNKWYQLLPLTQSLALKALQVSRNNQYTLLKNGWRSEVTNVAGGRWFKTYNLHKKFNPSIHSLFLSTSEEVFSRLYLYSLLYIDCLKYECKAVERIPVLYQGSPVLQSCCLPVSHQLEEVKHIFKSILAIDYSQQSPLGCLIFSFY